MYFFYSLWFLIYKFFSPNWLVGRSRSLNADDRRVGNKIGLCGNSGSGKRNKEKKVDENRWKKKEHIPPGRPRALCYDRKPTGAFAVLRGRWLPPPSTIKGDRPFILLRLMSRVCLCDLRFGYWIPVVVNWNLCINVTWDVRRSCQTSLFEIAVWFYIVSEYSENSRRKYYLFTLISSRIARFETRHICKNIVY